MRQRMRLCQQAQCFVVLKNMHPSIFQMPCLRSYWTISVGHINPKWHAAAFHTNAFSYLLIPLPGRPSIVPRCLWSYMRRVQLKSSFTNSLPLLHQIFIFRPLHHLHQGTLFRMEFSTPPIGQNTLPLSGIRVCRLIMTWNYPPRMFLWLTLLLLKHCLRDRYGGGMALISLLG